MYLQKQLLHSNITSMRIWDCLTHLVRALLVLDCMRAVLLQIYIHMRYVAYICTDRGLKRSITCFESFMIYSWIKLQTQSLLAERYSLSPGHFECTLAADSTNPRPKHQVHGLKRACLKYVLMRGFKWRKIAWNVYIDLLYPSKKVHSSITLLIEPIIHSRPLPSRTAKIVVMTTESAMDIMKKLSISDALSMRHRYPQNSLLRACYDERISPVSYLQDTLTMW